MRLLALPFFLLVIGTHDGLAQDLHADGTKGIFDPKMHEKFAQDRLQQNSAPSAKGPANPYQPTDYLFTNWTRGVLQPYGSGAPQRAWLKYNAFNHQLISRSIVKETEVINIVNLALLREFTIGDSLLGLRLTYRRYLDARVPKPSLRTTFFEVHYDAGKTALLCRRTHKAGLPQPGPGGFSGRQDVLSYFLKTADNQILPVTLGPAEVLGALAPAHGGAATTYAQQQRLDLRRENDVVRLLAYCDTL